MNHFSISVCRGDFSKTEAYKSSTYAHIPLIDMSADSELDLVEKCRFEIDTCINHSSPHSQLKSGYLFILHGQIYIVDDEWESYAKLKTPKAIPQKREVILPLLQFILTNESKAYDEGVKGGAKLARDELKNWLNAG